MVTNVRNLSFMCCQIFRRKSFEELYMYRFDEKYGGGYCYEHIGTMPFARVKNFVEKIMYTTIMPVQGNK